jgi:hypothetical protein
MDCPGDGQCSPAGFVWSTSPGRPGAVPPQRVRAILRWHHVPQATVCSTSVSGERGVSDRQFAEVAEIVRHRGRHGGDTRTEGICAAVVRRDEMLGHAVGRYPGALSSPRSDRAAAADDSVACVEHDHLAWRDGILRAFEADSRSSRRAATGSPCAHSACARLVRGGTGRGRAARCRRARDRRAYRS